MVDRLHPARRSWNMSRIRSGDTKPEKIVRSLLHAMGYRYRLHRKDLPGTPDIVLPKYKTVIFVHGCFWHRHPDCKNATNPKTNADFWEKKFAENVERDNRNRSKLEELGWSIVTIWECETEKPPIELSAIIVGRIESRFSGQVASDILMVAENRTDYSVMDKRVGKHTGRRKR
jgi:DNA mismatch endonuclease, patch repair protein